MRRLKAIPRITSGAQKRPTAYIINPTMYLHMHRHIFLFFCLQKNGQSKARCRFMNGKRIMQIKCWDSISFQNELSKINQKQLMTIHHHLTLIRIGLDAVGGNQRKQGTQFIFYPTSTRSKQCWVFAAF